MLELLTIPETTLSIQETSRTIFKSTSSTLKLEILLQKITLWETRSKKSSSPRIWKLVSILMVDRPETMLCLSTEHNNIALESISNLFRTIQVKLWSNSSRTSKMRMRTWETLYTTRKLLANTSTNWKKLSRREMSHTRFLKTGTPHFSFIIFLKNFTFWLDRLDELNTINGNLHEYLGKLLAKLNQKATPQEE